MFRKININLVAIPVVILIVVVIIAAAVWLTARPASGEEPPLLISIEAPTSAPYGHWPVPVTFEITNTSSSEIQITPTTWIGGYNWGGSLGEYIFPDNNNDAIIWINGADRDITTTWAITIAPNDTVKFGFTADTESTVETSTKKFIELTVGNQIISQSLALTEGPGLTGTISVSPKWPYNEAIYWLDLTTMSRYMGQFVAQGKPVSAFTSDCKIADLPAGFYGINNRTFETHRWSIQVLGGGPTCTITGQVWHNENGSMVGPIIATATFTNPLWKPRMWFPHIQQP